MITTEVAQAVVGNTAFDNEGNKLGKISEIYFDDDTSEPAWVTVQTGLFGTKQSFVPLADASVGHDEDVTVGYSKDQIQDAPRVDADEHLSVEEEAELYRYYGLADRGADTAGKAEAGYAGYADGTSGRDDYADAADGTGHDTS